MKYVTKRKRILKKGKFEEITPKQKVEQEVIPCSTFSITVFLIRM